MPRCGVRKSISKLFNFADDLLVISPSPEGLQQSLDIIHKHAQDWKLNVNTKKSSIIKFSGN